MAPIRSLLYPVDPTEAPEPEWLEAAVSAAKTLGAHLEVLHAQVSPIAVMRPGIWGISEDAMRGITQAAEQFMSGSVKQVRKELKAVAGRLGVPVVANIKEAGEGPSVALVAGEPGLRSVMVSLKGRVADLVVVRQPTERNLESATLAAAMKETGHPVLVLPKGTKSIAADKVGVAWNGRVEVARAVTGSLPILRSASEVHVMTSRKRSQSSPTPSQLADYLALHGVKAKTHTLDADGTAVVDALFGEAKRLGLDLLVAGAYSRSRVHDVIFGSATRKILLQSKLPLVVAH
ncbi:MAG: universal stress protein [Gammaproteobacteria bacterium]|nr:universal stress protein [Gammaproteobacteria bacterium]